MSDTVIFMSAYKILDYSKSPFSFKMKPKLKDLLEKHHLTFVLSGDRLKSSKGTLRLCTEYDYIQQKTSFSFAPINDTDNIDDFSEIIENAGFCINLLHARSVLADTDYFDIDCFIHMASFIVKIGAKTFQIDPAVFIMNGSLNICFEVIDSQTGTPLSKDDVFGQMGNYNLLKVNGYKYFNEESVTPSDHKIADIIYNNISNFFIELVGGKFVPGDYYYLHNTLVLSSNVSEISSCFCSLIGTTTLPSPLKNISTTNNYDYYPQDGVSVITNYDPNDVIAPLYAGIMLETIKLYVYLLQIINLEVTRDINKVIQGNLYLESLFFSPHVPIETHNLLNCIYYTSSYQHNKEASKLKISYMNAENNSKKSRNGILLNVLLYIISLIGAIETLGILESKLNIPFKYSLTVVIFAFTVFGAIWGISEWRQNRRF